MASPIKLSPLVAPFTVDAKGLKQLQEIERAGVAFTKKLGAGMEKTGRLMTRFVTAPILGAGIASAKFAMDFNKGMANVASLMPGQSERVVQMKKEVLDLAAASGMATGDLTKGLYQTISAFGDAGDPVKKLAITARAAKAGLASAEEGINLISATTLAYGDSSEAALQKVSDLALLTVRLGKTTFPELSESIGRVASSGNALGVSQEEIFASFATLSGVTGKTTEVSTQLSAVLGGMMKPTDGMKKLMKKLGYESTEAMMKEKGLAGSLDVLSDATGGSTAKLGKLFESKEALLAITALLGPQAQTYTDKLKEMNNASGTTAEALKEQEQGINKVGNEFEKSKQKLMVTAIRIGDRLLPVVTKLTDKLVPLLEKITSLSDSQLEFGLKVAGFAALAGPAIWALGSLTTSIMALRDGYLLLKTAMGGAKLAETAAQAGTLSANVGSAAANTTKLSKAMGGLQSAFGVAAAATIGWQLGSMVTDALESIDRAGTNVLNRISKESMQVESMKEGEIREKLNAEKRNIQSEEGTWNTTKRLFAGALGYNEGSESYVASKQHAMRLENQLKVLEERKRLNAAIEARQKTSTGFTADPFSGVASSIKNQSVDLNIKIDAPDGAKVGVNSKGANPKVQNKRGGIMQPGLAI